MDYESISVENMAPACGGIIEHVDLSKDITNQQFDEIYHALLERTVIIFRNQNLTERQHVKFSRRFGEIQPSAVSGFEKHNDYPEIDILEYGFIIFSETKKINVSNYKSLYNNLSGKYLTTSVLDIVFAKTNWLF